MEPNVPHSYRYLIIVGGSLLLSSRALAVGPPPVDEHASLGPRVSSTSVAPVEPSASPRRPRAKTIQPRRRARYRLVQLRSGPGYDVRTPQRAWGTPLTVSRLEEVLLACRLSFLDTPAIVVQDLSRRRGGRLEPHLSHRDGRDVDVQLPRKGNPRRWGRATRKTLDVERTWFLLHALIQTGDVEYIFLDNKLERLVYRHALQQGEPPAKLREIFRWVVRDEPGHDAHFHVRFRKGRPGDGRQSRTMELALSRASAAAK